MRSFTLPLIIADLVLARNRLREHYRSSNLEFTLDGNLVGDIGEAVAAELFGLKLTTCNGTGVDGTAVDGRTVQVKATGTNRGPAFRMIDTRVQHLLFLAFDFKNLKGEIIYNGPEETAVSLLPKGWVGQRSLTKAQIRRADQMVPDAARLVRLATEHLAG